MKTVLALNIKDTSEEALAQRSVIQEASVIQNLKNGMFCGGLALIQLGGLGAVLVLKGATNPVEQLLALALLAESAFFGRRAFLSIREAFKKIAALEKTINANGLTIHGVFAASKGDDAQVTSATNVLGRINRK